MTDLTCWNCSAAIVDEPLPLSRRAQCRACFAELHCCRMCRHHAPGRPDACAEDRAEVPANKEAANVCEWFDPASGRGTRRDPEGARSRLDALFGGEDTSGPDEGDPPEPDASAAARAKLDDLFGGGDRD